MSPPKILVVDDDKLILELLTDILVGEGFEVRTAKNGIDALERLNENTPDLIVCDVMMPEMNGYELLSVVQNDKNTSTIPFVFLSSKSQVKDRIKGYNRGADDYITKPFDDAELIAKIRVRLQRREELLLTKGEKHDNIKGDLAILPVIDLVQMLMMRALTGQILIQSQDGQGLIYLNKGEIADVIYRGYNSYRAFRQLIINQEGTFSFHPAEIEVPVKINVPTQKFILECCRQVDELHSIYSRLPPLDTPYHLVLRQSENVLKLLRGKSKNADSFISSLQGTKTLRELLSSAEYDEFEIAQLVEQLIHEKILISGSSLKETGQKENVFEARPNGAGLKQRLVDYLDAHGENFGIIILGQNREAIKSMVAVLAQELGEHFYGDSLPSGFVESRKIMLDPYHWVSVYGLTNARQFSFFRKNIEGEILCYLLLHDGPQILEDSQLIADLKEITAASYPPLVYLFPETHFPEQNSLREKLLQNKAIELTYSMNEEFDASISLRAINEVLNFHDSSR